MAASEEELLLIGLFGEDAERLLRAIRGRASADDDELAGVDKARSERIRELVRIVQETSIGELTIEEDGMRVSVRSTAEAPAAAVSQAPLALPGARPGARALARRTASSRSSRRWSARSTGPPSRARRRSSRSATSSLPGRRSASSRR